MPRDGWVGQVWMKVWMDWRDVVSFHCGRAVHERMRMAERCPRDRVWSAFGREFGAEGVCGLETISR